MGRGRLGERCGSGRRRGTAPPTRASRRRWLPAGRAAGRQHGCAGAGARCRDEDDLRLNISASRPPARRPAARRRSRCRLLLAILIFALGCGPQLGLPLSRPRRNRLRLQRPGRRHARRRRLGAGCFGAKPGPFFAAPLVGPVPSPRSVALRARFRRRSRRASLAARTERVQNLGARRRASRAARSASTCRRANHQ